MPFFQYNAVDAAAKSLRGTIQAGSAQEAKLLLEQRGFRVASVVELGDFTPSTRTVQSVPLPADVVRTVYGSDKDRLFIFAQLAASLKAGINPAQALDEISRRSKSHFTESLKEAGDAAVHGKPISDVFARYPDLYPEHVVGVLRAAELGGFLPEAFEEISRQAESSHHFKRWFFWVGFVIVNTLLTIPGTWILMRTTLRTWDSVDAKGGVGAHGGQMTASEMVHEMGAALAKELLWPLGPLTLLVWLIVWLIRRYFGSRIGKRSRHVVSSRAPVFGKRTKHESLARFSWTMSRVSHVGIAPARAWQVAAESVPNLEIRDQLVSIGAALSGQEKMSDILFRTKLFPDAYAPVVATAEFTGDLPGALDQLARLSQGEFQSAQNQAKARSGCWGALGCFVTAGISIAIFCYVMYQQLPAKVLNGTEP